ncbi:hypothetical protein [Kineococcus sp. SYSU DK001]|uniref:hypothetical protein n=1 Tax=Kineococcus sp. SYSU DK001 TaxID=3383122 RepID=UPI003D7C5BD7
MTQRLHRRLLAAGLVAGITTAGLASTAQAATVSTGTRQSVQVAPVSPTALPATVEAGATRRTTQVTITL